MSQLDNDELASEVMLCINHLKLLVYKNPAVITELLALDINAENLLEYELVPTPDGGYAVVTVVSSKFKKFLETKDCLEQHPLSVTLDSATFTEEDVDAYIKKRIGP